MSDIETALLAWLRARPDLDGYAFGTRRPADLGARLPFVLITRAGGAASLPTWRVGPVLDRAGISVQTWATPDQLAARATAAAVLAALYAARSVRVAGVTIVRIGSLAGPAPVPDPDGPEHVHRMVASVLVTAR